MEPPVGRFQQTAAQVCSGPPSTRRTMRLKPCLTISRATERLCASACFPTKQSELRVSWIRRAHRLDAPYYSFRAAASRADKQRPVFKSAGRLGSSREFVIDNGEATDFPAGAHFIYRENGETFNKSRRERTPVLTPSTPSLVGTTADSNTPWWAEALAESELWSLAASLSTHNKNGRWGAVKVCATTGNNPQHHQHQEWTPTRADLLSSSPPSGGMCSFLPAKLQQAWIHPPLFHVFCIMPCADVHLPFRGNKDLNEQLTPVGLNFSFFVISFKADFRYLQTFSMQTRVR